MTSGRYTIVGLGEIVWDLLPAGPRLGGAPANFAYFASLLGNHAVVASRVGSDELGHKTLQRLHQSGLPTVYVQRDDTRPTGTVRVRVDEQGQPDFTITEMAAWDFLEFTPQWQALAVDADAVCFGALAQRSTASRETIRKFLSATRKDALRVFDVNLRQSFYSAEVLGDSLRQARVVKLNHLELPIVAAMFDLAGDTDEARARALLRAYSLEMVCVTRGAHGSLLVNAAEAVSHAGIPVTTADAIGAGDAFTAALAHHYLRGARLAEIGRAANLLGAWVASQVGATPTVEAAILRQVIEGAEVS
ncbi:MAG TPA: carbohydrate kinase [Blastocatellia bacterium]|nr:carbohydrate kinase [Blastocatellia bacterium]